MTYFDKSTPFSYTLFKEVFVKNDNPEDPDNVSLNESFMYNQCNFDEIFNNVDLFLEKELIDILYLYELNMTYTNFSTIPYELNYKHKYKVNDVIKYITKNIDKTFMTDTTYTSTPSSSFCYTLFDSVFLHNDQDALDLSFHYEDNDYLSIKTDHTSFSVRELRDILYMYTFKMDYYNSGNEYKLEFKHESKVDNVIQYFDDYLYSIELYDDDDEEEEEDDDEYEDDGKVITDGKYEEADDGGIFKTEEVLDNSMKEHKTTKTTKTSKKSTKPNIEEDWTTSKYSKKEGYTITDRADLIDNFLLNLDNPLEFKHLLGLKTLVTNSTTFVESLDKVLNDYFHLEFKNLDKTNNDEVINLNIDINKSKDFIIEIADVCDKYKFNNKYQSFLQSMWDRIDNIEKSNDSSDEESEEDCMIVTI